MKLTLRVIDALNCPAGRKDRLVFDDEQAGLGVRVTASGGKTYLAQYTVGGRKRRVPLGSCSAISLAAARDAVRAILGDVAKGRDPAAERRERARTTRERVEQDKLTFDVLIARWEQGRLSDRRQGYRAEATRALRYAFAKQLTTPASDLDAKTIRRIVNAVSEAGKKATAKLMVAYGRACYSWAVERDLLVANPFGGIKADSVQARDRVLTDVELGKIWQATGGPGSYCAILRLLILTGQRREEVGGMTWDEVEPDLLIWTIPGGRAKNGVAHIVPLSQEAQAILRAAPRTASEGDNDRDRPRFVFPGRDGSFGGWSKAKAALDDLSGVKDWRLHDLRRTMATGFQRLGVRLEVTEAVLNHVAGSRAGIIGVYQRHTWAEEKRAALKAWGEHVAAIVEGREAGGNVTAFPLKSVQ